MVTAGLVPSLLLVASVASATADVQPATVEDGFNDNTTPAEDFSWAATEVGWSVTISHDYTLTGIETMFGSGDGRFVTIEVFSAPPGLGGTLLRRATMTPEANTFAGGFFAPLAVTEGQTLFIGFRNVAGLYVNFVDSGTPLLDHRYSFDGGSYEYDYSNPPHNQGIIRLLSGDAPPDTTPPVLSDVPGDITVPATSPDGATVTYSQPTAVDGVDGEVAVVCSPASGSLFPIGTTEVVCTATDSSDNTATAFFYVTVGPVPNAVPMVAVDGAGGLTDFFDFDNANGNGPAGLTLEADGNFYGTTVVGGDHGSGTVFRMTPGGVLTTLVSFDGTNNSGPYAPVIRDGDGHLYGTTTGGGSENAGTVFKLAPDGTLTTLATFSGPDGSSPFFGKLLRLADGTVMGTTVSGGDNGSGVIYRIPPGGALEVLASFDSTTGSNPYAGMLLGTDGNFYGTASGGGAFDSGTVWKLTPTGELSALASLDGPNGASPLSDLVERDGVLYGTCYFGGSENRGSVFKVTLAGELALVASFTATDGAHPAVGLQGDAEGNLIGVTFQGGTSGVGTLFRVTTDGTLTTLASFDPAVHGAYPITSPALGADGSYYGAAREGGPNSYGTIYRFNSAPGLSAAEGSVVTQTGTFSDADGNETVVLTASSGTMVQDHEAGTWTWTATVDDGPASGTVTITATDGESASATASFSFTVTNVVPTVAISAPATAYAGEPVEFTLTATDASAADQAAGFTFSVDYDDQAASPAPLPTASPSTKVHSFVPGTYLVTVTAYDKDGGASMTATHEIVITTEPTVTLTGANDVVTTTGGTTRILPLANDRSPSGRELTLVSVSDPSVLIDGRALILPAGFTGPLTYTFTDGTETGEATINVAAGSAAATTTWSGLLYHEDGAIAGIATARSIRGVTDITITLGSSKQKVRVSATDPVPVSSPFGSVEAVVDEDGRLALTVTGASDSFTGLLRHAASSTTSGLYNVAVAGADRSTVPGGGYLRARLTTSGRTRVSGKLPDGRAFSTSATLQDNGTFAFYTLIPRTSPAAVVAGEFTLADLAATDVTGEIEWSLPPQGSGLHASGVSATLVANGSLYDSADALPSGPVEVRFSGADLPGESIVSSTATNGKVERRTEITAWSASGRYGTFTARLKPAGATAVVKATGIYLPKTNSAWGFFPGLTVGGQVEVTPASR